jgi:hypothetical protein
MLIYYEQHVRTILDGLPTISMATATPEHRPTGPHHDPAIRSHSAARSDAIESSEA